MTNLEAAIAQDPTDTMTLQVWADSLISAGDPLGEYLSLSIHQTAKGFLDADDNRARLSELRSRHLLDWVGGFGPENLVWRSGIPVDAAFPQTTSAQLDTALAGLLASRLGRFVNRLAVQVSASDQVPILERHLGERPMLEQLTLTGELAETRTGMAFTGVTLQGLEVNDSPCARSSCHLSRSSRLCFAS